jgi:hypothetical protein
MPSPAAVAVPEKREPKLLERVRDALRVRHLSLRTEKAYLHWIRRYILFHRKRQCRVQARDAALLPGRGARSLAPALLRSLRIGPGPTRSMPCSPANPWRVSGSIARSKEYAARRRGEDFDRMKDATVETLTLALDPLPCWSGLSEDRYRERIASLLARIEADARAEREKRGTKPLGREAVLAQDPHDKPVRSKKSPAPRFHAFRKSVRRELYDAYASFVAAFRDASEKLRAGDLTAKFPSGSFPPALSFVS